MIWPFHHHHAFKCVLPNPPGSLELLGNEPCVSLHGPEIKLYLLQLLHFSLFGFTMSQVYALLLTHKEGSNLVCWLTEIWPKGDVQWIGNARVALAYLEERIWIERLLEMGILEWIYHERPVHPPWEHPEDRPFNTIVRDRFSGSPSTFEELHNHSSL